MWCWATRSDRLEKACPRRVLPQCLLGGHCASHGTGDSADGAHQAVGSVHMLAASAWAASRKR